MSSAAFLCPHGLSKELTMLGAELSSLASFPCSADKVPLVQHGFKNARRANWQSPLVGVPTGQVNGIDVLDIDPEGRSWFDQNFASLPKTQAHETQRGLHLLFKHATGLRCSAGRIAAGVGCSSGWRLRYLVAEGRAGG